MTLSSIFRHRTRQGSGFGKKIRNHLVEAWKREEASLTPTRCGNMCLAVMWSVNIEPFLRWWRLWGPGVRRHHRGAMKEWQRCTQTVHSALWEKKGKTTLIQQHIIPMAFYWMTVVLQWRISPYTLYACLFSSCVVMFSLGWARINIRLWLGWAGARRMCTLYHVTRIASGHSTPLPVLPLATQACAASLSQAVTARPGGRGRSRDCHASQVTLSRDVTPWQRSDCHEENPQNT